MTGTGNKTCDNSEKVFAYLYALQCEENNCDLCLISEDGEKFYVHGFVVLRRIPRIRKTTCGVYERVYRNNQPLHLTKVNGRELRRILDYAYYGNYSIPKDAGTALQLMEAATFLEMGDLTEKCMGFIHHTIDFDTALHILDSSQKSTVDFLCDSHIKAAKNFVLEHVVTSGCSTISLELLETLLQDPNLRAACEEDVVAFVLQWILCKPFERKVYLPRLLDTLRLGLLAPGSLDIISKFSLVAENKTAISIIKVIRATLRCYHRRVNVINNETELAPIAFRPRMPYETLLMFGGWDEIRRCICNMTHAYDYLADKWIEVTGLTLPETRAYHGTEVIDGNIYIIGGFSSTTDDRSSVNTCLRLRLHPTDTEDKRVVWEQWEPIASMQRNRCFIATTVLEKHIYAIGGRDGEIRNETVERYDTVRDVWEMVPQLPQAISDAAAATLNGKIYVVGGFSGTVVYEDAFEYDPVRSKWKTIPFLNVGRSGLKLVVLMDCLYAIGGFDGTYRTNVVERYDPKGTMEGWQMMTSMLQGRSNFACSVLHDRVIVCGGYTNNGVSSFCEIYDPQLNQWCILSSLPQPWSGMECCLIENDLKVSHRAFAEERGDPCRPPRYLLDGFPRLGCPKLAALLTPLPDLEDTENFYNF